MAETTTDITQEQPKEPLLIDYNGSQYDYDEFKKLAYSTLGNTFQKYGKKYYKNFDELKKDLDILVNAIGETYNGNPRVQIYSDRIEDRKGELKNESKSDKAIKDRMGYIGGHIVKTLNTMSPYLKPEPEPKKQLSQELLTRDLYRNLFNQETIPTDLTDWYNQDSINNNTRGTTQRMNSIINALNSLNYDEDYEIPEGFQNLKLDLNSIINDNNITENEYATLRKYFGWDNGVNWDALLKTDFSPEPMEIQLQEDRYEQIERKPEDGIRKPVSEESNIEDTAILLTAFEKLSSDINIQDIFLDQPTLAWFTQELGVDADSIFQLTLLKLIKDNKAKFSNGKYYFPTITNKNDLHPVATISNNLMSIDWVSENDKEWAVVTSKAKGGILKALLGDGLTYNDTWDDDFINLIDWNTSSNERYKHTFNNNKVALSHRSGTGARNTIAPNNTKYNIEPGGELVEKQSYWLNWIKALTTNENLAKAWADRYKELEKITGNENGTETNHYKDWYDENGNFIFENFKNSTLWSDLKNGIGHDIYKGNVYFIEDDNGTKKYYSKDDLEKNGYIQDDTYTGTLNNPLLTEYKYIKKPEKETRAEETPTSGEETPTSGEETPTSGETVTEDDGSTMFNKDLGDKSEATKKTSNFNFNWVPEVVDLAALLGSWYTNNKAYKARLRRPYLTLSPELRTYVRGDLNAYLAGVNQGADLMSRVNQFGMTSDASLNNASMSNAWINASKYIDQGRQLYDTKTEATRLKANELSWENTKNHVANANNNMKNIFETSWYNGDLKAQKYVNNFNSLLNYFNNLKQLFLDDRAQKNYYKFYEQYERNSLLQKTLANKEQADYKRQLNAWTETFLNDNPTLKEDYKYAYNPIYQEGVLDLSNSYYNNVLYTMMNDNLGGIALDYDAGLTAAFSKLMEKYNKNKTTTQP